MLRHLTLRACAAGLVAASLLLFGLSTSAHAQGASIPPPPSRLTIDENGIDLVTRAIARNAPEVTIGQPGAGGLAYARFQRDGRWYHSFVGTMSAGSTGATVSIGGQSDVFTLSGGVYSSQSGSALTLAGTTFTYTATDGTVATFTPDNADISVWDGSHVIRELRRPNGEILTFTYNNITVYAPCPITCPVNAIRLHYVTSNAGYRVLFTYKANTATGTGNIEPWLSQDTVTGFNLAVDNCYTATCTFSRTWPSVTYSSSAFKVGAQTVTDQSGRVTEYLADHNVILPGATAPVTAYGMSGTARTVTRGSGTWTYAVSDSGTTRTMTVTDPASNQTVAISNLSTGLLTSLTNPLGQARSFLYDANGRVTRITEPEGNYVAYTYDARGNLTQTRQVAKSGSGLADIVTSATYPSTCTNLVTCNQPTSTTDAAGGVTNYTYDATHGGVLTVTRPAPTTGAVRPQTRITYSALSAWYKNNAGSIVAAPNAITLPTRVSACASAASCNNAAGEVRTTITYGASGVANNLLPTAITQGSGNGAVTSTVSLTHDPNGDPMTVDGPLSGTIDTTRYRYDANRQLAGMQGPRADGVNPPHRAVRYTYDPRGNITLAEQGTTPTDTDSGWASFTPLQRIAYAYDALGRATHARAQSGSTTYGLTQTTYDALGRTDCVATRMNPATFASPPASACTPATAATFGPDRIVKYGYDAASRVTALTTGYGVAGATTETYTYSANGRQLTARDGANRTSTWVYDGFDRISRLRFPNPTGTGSSTSDYEAYTYTAAGETATYRTRAGQTFTLGHDALGRTTSIDAPAPMADTAFTYDNLDRALTATQPGHTITNAWDALSRLTSQTGPRGTYGFQYDAASRRTRITWPDAFYVQYDWNLYDQMTRVRENGATSGAGILAAYSYDDRGRRTGITRGNGVATTYGYDPISRLTSLSHNLPGTVSDVALGYAYNPAGQVVSETTSNDAYVKPIGNEATTYTIDGRSRITAVNGTTLTYDNNGNLTNDGTRTYSYDAANRLLNAGGTAMTYDPAGQIYGLGSEFVTNVDGGPTTLHTSTGAVIRRFVPGASQDETVGYYVGPVASDRRYIVADHQNSSMGVTDASGAVAGANTYDEFGVQGAGNQGYPQYTGQLWLSPSLPLYSYKNRVYHPQLGRFLQTDPIGYGAGLNLYNYVGGDPVNRTDPFGLQEVVCYIPPGTETTRTGYVSGPVCTADLGVIPVTAPKPGNGGDWGCIGGAYACGGAPTMPIGEAITNFGRGGSSGPAHDYPITRRLQCSASQAFADLRRPGISAPGAPYAEEGTHDLMLSHGNPITQTVDPGSFTITNTTREGHRYHPGTVVIRVVPTGPYTSTLTIQGSGTTPRAFENFVTGSLFFGVFVADGLASRCNTPMYGD